MTPCEHCGRDTPDLDYCIWCGAHRVPGVVDPQARHRSYAAHTGEHVAHPSVVTTLFPHLPSHRIHEFRWALLGGLAVIVTLVSTGLIVAAILAAAVLVPVLYLVYLYEAQVYRDEPAQVLGLTIGAGVILGVIVTVIANHVFASKVLLGSQESVGLLLGTTLLLPVIQEVVKAVPVLSLRRIGAFAETIDGLAFGVACGLGFAGAQTIVDFSKVIANEPVHASSANWIFPVIGIAVLNPLIQGSCAGAVAATLWRLRSGSTSRLALLGLPVAVIAHVAFSLVSQLLTNHGTNAATVLGWQALVVIALLVYIRFLVHHALLEEATHLGLQVLVCPSCAHHVGAAAFCPHCGAAVTAGPRTRDAGVTTGATATDDAPPAADTSTADV